jgi:hypothetical protein
MSDQAQAIFEPCSAHTWCDPFPIYKALRDQDPLHQVQSDGGDYVVAEKRRRSGSDREVQSARPSK